jgi:hypothetical protein
MGHDVGAWWATVSAVALLMLMVWFAIQELTSALGGKPHAESCPQPRANQPAGPLVTLGE